ncbi:MAG: GAF domain-containing protein [Bacteroidales bacterium]|nr:GAF domain-containing protein [Bacteroidales bacterium]
MAESFSKIEGTKEDKYQHLLSQVKAVVEGECDMIANMANVASMLHETFGFWWTGFYRVLPVSSAEKGEQTLVLGPFQGPLACTRIKKGKGVCGSAWLREETVIVPDVDMFPGHIACSSLSRSEIVVPVKKDGQVIAVLDIDSKELATFDETDKEYLEAISRLL